MTSSALTPLARQPSPGQVADPTNVLVGQFNRLGSDQFVPIYAADTGSGTAYVMTPTPGIAKVGYKVSQIFIFKAANANTGATPTLNVNGMGAGTITTLSGGALVAGDIPANAFVEVICTSTTPTFALLTPPAVSPPALQKFTNSLSGNVNITSISTYFSGPTVAQGTTGTWFASGNVTFLTGGGADTFVAKLWDGTTVIDAALTNVGGSGLWGHISLSGYLANPAGNIRIDALAVARTDGAMVFNASGTSKDCTVSAVRIG